MSPSANGKPATKEAKKLAQKDFSSQVAVLAEQRLMNRAFLRKAVGEFDPEYISLSRLYQMRKDPMIQMGLHYCKFPLIRAKWNIECEDPKIAAGVTEIIRNVYGPYTRVFLNMLDFGYQAGIKQFALGQIHGTYEDDRGNQRKIWEDEDVQPLLLEPPLPLPPDYVTPKIEKGKFAGIESALGFSTSEDGGSKDRFIPPEWALWTVNEFEEQFRNYYGYPRTGYAYRYWWSYWFRFHMEDRHFEMDADPALQIKYPPGSSPDGEGNPKSNRDLALEIGNDLRGGATIAWPSEVHRDDTGKPSTVPMWSAEFLQGGENLDAFRESASYLDVMKLRAILVPEQALIEGKGGTSSRNAAATYTDVFNESLAEMAEQLAWYWNRYLIGQIVEANWGQDAPQARMTMMGFEEEDMTLANELIKIAFTVDPNALPINFDDLIKQANLPILSAKEQKEREELLQEQQQQQLQQQKQELEQAKQEEDEGGEEGEESPEPPEPPQQQQFSRSPVVHLHQGEREVESTAPAWARVEAERRDANIETLQNRFEKNLEHRYADIVEASARYLEDLGSSSGRLSLAFKDRSKVKRFASRKRVKKFAGVYGGLKTTALAKLKPLDDRIRGDVASMYHASGSAELIRLGQDEQALIRWKVDREDIQDFADKVADRILSDSEKALLEVHIRPWLEEQFEGPSYDFEPEPALSLAQKLRVKFLKYPEWMAKRTARTEARKAYNNASLDVWELSGIKKVRAYDGLGGVTGKTDEICLRRNGQIMSIPEARREDASEHPNGTLGFVPVIEETVIKLSQAPSRAGAAKSDTPWVVDSNGFILTQEAVSELLTGDV